MALHVVDVTICGTGLYRHHPLRRSQLKLKWRVHGLLIDVVFREKTPSLLQVRVRVRLQQCRLGSDFKMTEINR